MGLQTTDGQSNDRYNYRTHRSEQLRRRNRRVGLIALLVVIGLVIFTVIYVTFYGGVNVGPRPPLHSSASSAALREIV